MSEPLELVVRGKEAVVAFACRGCGALFAASVAGAKGLADLHCTQVCPCGRPLHSGMVLCKECTDKELRDRESKLYTLAAKVSIDDYPDQPLYWEGHAGSMGIGFFSNVDDLLDYCDEERESLDRRGIDAPKYVWACQPKPLELSAQDVALAAVAGYMGCDDVGEDALARLQVLLDGWAKEQGFRAWVPDFAHAVLLTE